MTPFDRRRNTRYAQPLVASVLRIGRSGKREPGEMPGLPRSGKRERPPSSSTGSYELGSDGQ